MKVLITGGAGFIASHIVDKYIQLGHEVIVVDDLSTGTLDNLNQGAKFHKLDIRSQETSQLIKTEKPEIINHHAAQIDLRKSVEDPIFDAQNNILGLINIMEAAKEAGLVRKLIFASTGGAIYGDADTIPTPETYQAWPRSPYGISKLSGEHYLHFYNLAYQIPFISLRYGNVYGPRQNPHGEAGVIAIFTKKMLEGEQPIINGDGKQTRDFVFVSDVVRANELATEKNISGIYNIGTGKETNINMIFTELAKQIDPQIKIDHGPAKKGEQRRSALDSKKAKEDFGWKAKVSLDQGLETTIEYFKKQ